MKTHLRVSSDGHVAFYVVERAVDEWNFETYDAYGYESEKPNLNPVATIRMMHRELVNYVLEHRPPVLYFKGNTDKKHRVYRTLLEKFPLPSYTCIEWEGTIYLYRLEADA